MIIWKGDDLITPGIAPHAPYTNTDESLKEAYEIPYCNKKWSSRLFFSKNFQTLSNDCSKIRVNVR